MKDRKVKTFIYEAFGFPFPKHKIRLAQLIETIDMMNLMFTEHKCTYEGMVFKWIKRIYYGRS